VSSTILGDIVRDYEAVSTAWFSALGPIAHRIFWILVAIQLTWSAIWWVLDREDGLGVLSSLLRQVVAIGFFYALLLNSGTWIPAVIQGFSQAGATAAGITDLSPTGVFDQGLALANKILNSTADLGLLDGFFASLIAGITALVVVVAFAVIAAQLLVVLVESFIVIGAGILFLGFAGAGDEVLHRAVPQLRCECRRLFLCCDFFSRNNLVEHVLIQGAALRWTSRV
jgi:type IV secretion system protein TrbL